MGNPFATDYLYRKYRGFEANDAVKENWAKLVVCKEAGTDGDGELDTNTHNQADFDDVRLATIGNTFQKEWKEYLESGVLAHKWFKVTEAYSSIAGEDISIGEQNDVEFNDCSGFVNGDWVVVWDDNDTVGELIQVSGVTTGSGTEELDFATTFQKAYTTGNNCKVALAYYFYYDKAAETAHQDGANVFLTFDDFERGNNGDPVGGSWTIDDGDVDISTEQDIGDVAGFTGTRSMKIIGGTTRAKVNIPITASDNIAIRWRFYKEDASITSFYHGDGTNRITILVGDDEKIYYNDGDNQDTGATANADAWDLYEVNDFRWATPDFDIWHEGAEIQANAGMREQAFQENIFHILGDTTGGRDCWVDDLIVCNYPDIAGAGFGAEESEAAPTEYTKTTSIDILLMAQDSASAAVDILLKKLADNKQAAIDIYLRAQDTKTAAVDVIIVSRDNKTVSLDSMLRDTDSKSISLDAYIQATGLTKTAALDAVLVGRDIEAISLDVLIKALGVTKAAAVDIYLQVPGITKTAAIDIVLVGRDIDTVTLDLILKALADISKTANVDILLKKLADSKTVSLDMFVAALGITKTAAVDIVLLARDSKAVSLDAVLKALGVTKTAAVDILLKEYAITKTTAVDLYIKDTSISTTDLSAVLRATDSKTAAVDLILRGGAFTKTTNIDLYIQATDSKTAAIDAYLAARDVVIVGIDIILVKRGLAERYIVEVHQSDGDLVCILKNAYGINWLQIINSPHVLRFDIKADDANNTNITKANELWIRDYETDTVLKRFKLAIEGDKR